MASYLTFILTLLDHSLRLQLVQILSATSNSCLNELGYFPGLLSRFRESEQLNEHYKKDIEKLYEDNRRLLALHEKTTKFLQAPESAKLKENINLDSKIRILSDERSALILHHHETAVKYQQLLVDFNHLKSIHQCALNEITLLRSQCSRSGGSGKAVSFQIERICCPLVLYLAVISTPQLSHVWPISISVITIFIFIFIFFSLQGVPIGKTTVSRASPLPNSDDHQSIVSGFCLKVEPTVIDASRIHSSSPISPQEALARHYSYEHPRKWSHSQQHQVHHPMIPTNSRQPRVPSHTPTVPFMNGRAPPTIHRLQTSNLTRLLPSTMLIPAQQQQQQPFSAFFSTSPASQTAPMIPIAPSSSTSMVAAAPGTTQGPPPPSAVADLRKSMTPSTPTLSIGNHASPTEFVEALTPGESATPTTDLPNVESPSTYKRSNEEMQEQSYPVDEARKKSRLEADQEHSVTSTEVKPDPPLVEAVGGGEESDDEVVEVDVDGLLLPKYCVAKMMEENENSIFSCRGCE